MKLSRLALIGFALSTACFSAPSARADKDAAPPPPQAPGQVAQTPVQTKALGDSFNLENPETEPPIPESRAAITNECSADAIGFDPCQQKWFFVPQPGNPTLKNAMGLTEREVQERDRLFSLAALAVVNEDWQYTPADAKKHPELAGLPRRGHNIGGVLVDDQGKLVWWERNSNGIECSGANHGEVRTMMSYLKFSRRNTLSCHTIYTSLEPCAQCSGMMSQQKIARTLYVQKDHGFGAAIERLHQPYGPRHFDCSYPRVPISKQADIPEAGKLDAAFHLYFKQTGDDDLTSFLQTDKLPGGQDGAKPIYQSAVDQLSNMREDQVFPSNQQALRDIKALIVDLKTIYNRSYVSMEQHVQIERMRRSTRVDYSKLRLGLPPDPEFVAPQSCCRPALMTATSLEARTAAGTFNGNAPLPAYCRVSTPVAAGLPTLDQLLQQQRK